MASWHRQNKRGDLVSKGPSHIRFVAAYFCVAAVTAACSSSGGGVEAASCVAPFLVVSRTAVHVGDSLTVSGHWFWTDCKDVVTRGEPPSPNTPIRTVRLVLQSHGGQLFYVGTAHPDSTATFSITITVPDEVRLGAAQVKDEVGLSSPAKIVVTP